MKNLSLEGVRIVDFSWVMAGPMTTKMLGAMGAEIIKVESSTRPEFSQRDGMFSVINNNKRSCTLNITSAEGQALVRQLVQSSDVVVENFSSRVLAQYQLSYEDLRALKPDLIFVSASGMGRTGPQRDLLAYGSLLQGYSGRVNMIGTPNASLEAMGILPAWTDPITALWETLAILAALRHRRETGEGSYVDLSMIEGTVALLPDALLHAALGLPAPEARSTTDPGNAPSGCFRCAGDDEWLAVSVGTQTEWVGFCEVFGDRKMAADARFADPHLRHLSKDILHKIVADNLRTRDAGELERQLRLKGVAASRSCNMGELVHDTHLLERGMFSSINGTVEMATLPWRTKEGWRGSFAPTPRIGEDNDYVFGTLLGLSVEQRLELAESGAIQ